MESKLKSSAKYICAWQVGGTMVLGPAVGELLCSWLNHAAADSNHKGKAKFWERVQVRCANKSH